MAEELYTVDRAAARLKLHRATVLRFIHDGRLAATRVGKSYRIQQSDLEALAGGPGRPEATRAQVTSIVDIDCVEPDEARRIAAQTTAALNGRPPAAAPLRVDVVHDLGASKLKIVLIGGPQDCAALLVLLQIWIES